MSAFNGNDIFKNVYFKRVCIE